MKPLFDSHRNSKFVILGCILFMIVYAISRLINSEIYTIPFVFSAITICGLILVYYFEDKTGNNNTPRCLYLSLLIFIILGILIELVFPLLTKQTLQTSFMEVVQLCDFSFFFAALLIPLYCRKSGKESATIFNKVGLRLCFLLFVLLIIYYFLPNSLNGSDLTAFIMKAINPYEAIIAIVATLLILFFFFKSYSMSLHNYKKVILQRNKHKECQEG